MYTIHETNEQGATIHELFRQGTTDRAKLINETLRHCGFELRKGTMQEKIARMKAVDDGIEAGTFFFAGKHFKVFVKNEDSKYVAVNEPESAAEEPAVEEPAAQGSTTLELSPIKPAETPKDKCIACEGKGESTGGKQCPICKGSGERLKDRVLEETEEHVEQAKAELKKIETESLPKVAQKVVVTNDQRIEFIKDYSAEIDKQYQSALRNAFADLKRGEGNLKEPFFSKRESATCIFCERQLRHDHPLTIKGSTEGDMAIYAHGFCLRDAIAVDPTKAALSFYASFRLKMRDNDLRAVLREWAMIEATVTSLVQAKLKAPDPVKIAIDRTKRPANVVVPEVNQETSVVDVATAAFAERQFKASADSIGNKMREALGMPDPKTGKTVELSDPDDHDDEDEVRGKVDNSNSVWID